MPRIRFVCTILAISAGTSAAQTPTLPARTLDVGAIVRLSTDSSHIVDQLATPFNTGRATLVNLFPCSRCAIAQYPISDVRTLDLREGSSRGTHVGLGFVIGAGIRGVPLEHWQVQTPGLSPMPNLAVRRAQTRYCSARRERS